MLSVLIPIYNYNAYPLVLELYKQCTECGIEFEIICIDDCSNQFLNENRKITSLKNCFFKELEKNIGRSAIRNLLARESSFENLIFLDSDTKPIHLNFISNYISQISKEEKVVYGGIKYQTTKPNKIYLLRWKYGNSREALSLEKRKKNVYLSFLSLNFLIHKSVFEKVSFNESIPNLRHEDTLFSYNLKQENIKVVHIDNSVYHLGLDSFEKAIKKENESLIGLKYLIDNHLIDIDYVRLSKLVMKIKKNRLVFVFAFFHRLTCVALLKNLSSNSPSLFIFDLYRLGILCSIENSYVSNN